MKKYILAIIVLIIILAALAWLIPGLLKTVEAPVSISTVVPKNFEEAINANNWAEVEKYLADDVTVGLEGTECCGLQTTSEAVEHLKRITGVKFTFDKTSDSVKAYLNYLRSQNPLNDPFDKMIKPGVRLRDLDLGVEDDPAQPNKAAIFYLTESNLVTLILIDKGRDRY